MHLGAHLGTGSICLKPLSGGPSLAEHTGNALLCKDARCMRCLPSEELRRAFPCRPQVTEWVQQGLLVLCFASPFCYCPQPHSSTFSAESTRGASKPGALSSTALAYFEGTAGSPNTRMSQGVTYADLRFVKGPAEESQQEVPDEGQLTYENLQVSRTWLEEEKTPTASRPEDTRESVRRTWFAALPVLGTCLFLLATTIGLGARYGQVSQQLRQESQGHAAQSSLLAQSTKATEQSLARSQQRLQEAERELSTTRVALEESWRAGNRTQQRLEEEVRRGNSSLAGMKQEKEEAERELEQARSCQQMGCCPSGWKLFRWKCMWIAEAEKTWQESKEDCERKSSQLLISKEPWDAATLWSYLQADEYWIGLRKSWQQVPWFWVDGSRYEGTEKLPNYYSSTCVKIKDGILKHSGCSTKYRYICEKAASPAQPGQ
ncbi:B-cell differentiation antigen CD72-like [Rhineura floridana]|uniref:B-cell differentiation antigen CD72-like n=1 Tax=Rhineura floridana TaxID=261503 RepID=UPI002AC8775F|nr:B-cell differentiation antigen CD72-like [Rhineura floridana]